MRIDTHCHIDRFPNPSEIADDCEANGLLVVAVTNLPSHFELGREHVAHHKFVKLALGLHPLNAANHNEEVERFVELLPIAECIGEIGLDFSKEGISSRDEQISVFTSILKALKGERKLITLNSRGAEAMVLSKLAEYDVGPAIFHWYSGSANTLKSVLDQGHYLSVNPAMVRSAKGKSLVGRLPKDRILTETDGPYVKVGKRAAVPNDIDSVLQHLAVEWNATTAEVENTIESNFMALTDLTA